MPKLLFVILLVNLDLAYGPLTMKPGNNSILKIFNIKSFPKLKMFKRNNSITHTDVTPTNAPVSKVEMPKQDLSTKRLSQSISYRPLAVEVTKFGNCFRPDTLEEYLEPPKTPTTPDYSTIELFCPTKNPTEDCMWSSTKQRECTTEAKPLIKPMIAKLFKDENSSKLENSADVSQSANPADLSTGDGGEIDNQALCGPNGERRMYTFGYQLCFKSNSGSKDSQKNEPKIRDYEIYNFCYDHERKETVYTQHEINWPKSLFDEELKQEQQMTFDMSTEDYGYFQEYFKIAHDVYTNSQNANQPQKLVPPEDFAFALWKLPTFHYANVRPQHQVLIKLWNLIGELIRNGSFAQVNIPHFIYTGAFRMTGTEYIHDKDVEIPEFWIKMVLIEHPKDQFRGLAILMGNNIEADSTTEWKTYCEQNYCDIANRKDELFEELTFAGRNVRCCRVNKQILSLFNLEKEFNDEEIQHLLIDGLIDSRFKIPPKET